MRPLIPREIELLSHTLGHLRGARFQKVISSQEDLVLEFWLKGEIYYLWFQDSTLRPYLTFWPSSLPFQFKKKVTPLALFLNAHFVHRRLVDVEYKAEEGRVLRLHFDKDSSIEFRIFPHGQNIFAKTLDKKLSLHKLADLKGLREEPDTQLDVRSVFDFSNEWHRFRQPSTVSRTKTQSAQQIQTTKNPGDVLRERSIKKSENAISKVEEELKRKQASSWRKVGDFLKLHNSFEDLPTDFEEYIDRRRSVSWNLNNAFEKAKDNQKKVQGTRERLAQLKKELEGIKAKNFDLFVKPPVGQQVRELKEKLGRARSLKLGEDLRVLSGKSARDNLDLLRQAKGWDLWLHLRDFPSSHAIIFRPKNRNVADPEKDRAIQWFFKQSFGLKWKNQIGEKFDVIVAECRHVKPIKGDRVGRVHYQNEKVLRRIVKAT